MKSRIGITLAAATAVTLIGASVPALAAPATTRLTVYVSNCDGCTVGWQRALASDTTATPKSKFKEGQQAKVSGGKVTFTVPTRLTQGMSFTISAPWEGNTGAAMNIVLGSGPGDAGAKVTSAQAKSRQIGSPCWAGTTKAKTSMRVSVAKVKVSGLSGSVKAPLAWASPTVATITPGKNGADTAPVSLDRGTAANQEAFYC